MTRSLVVMVLLAVSLAALARTYAQQPFLSEDRDWPYKELWSEADLVIIATASRPVSVANTSSFLPKFLQQLESEISVKATLKGAVQEGRDSVKLVHFRYRDDIRLTLGNGPEFVVMGTKANGPIIGQKPRYLLFLKARRDGRFEPVSGNMYPTASVVRLLAYPEKAPALR